MTDRSSHRDYGRRAENASTKHAGGAAPYRGGSPSSHPSRTALAFDQELFSSRLNVLFVLFLLFTIVIGVRLVWLQLIDAQSISERGTSREVTVDVQARRGTIYDRNGTILATTMDAYNVFCHPHMVSSDEVDRLASALAEVFGNEDDTTKTQSDAEESDEETDEETDSNGDSTSSPTYDKQYFKDKITTDENFVYLYKGADEESMQKIKDLGIEGVDFESTTKRVYPCGATASQVIGVLDTDGNALTGLELQYDDILGGTDGQKTTEYSKEGVPVPGSEQVTAEVVDGQDIVVSIDVGLQQEVEEALALRVEEVQGKTGSAIVMDAATGEIYACSSSPTFDITDLSEVAEGATNLSGISSSYEPGSIMKPVTMLAALEAGTVTLDSTYQCPVVLNVDGYKISDSHSRSEEEMDTTTIISESSNVGISLVAKDLGFTQLYDAIVRYKLCEATGIDYPGEASGYIASRDEWTEVQGYNISFGQGLTTTPLGMVRFYAMLANNGVATTPHFLKEIPGQDEPTYATEQITDNQSALDDLEVMMQAVVDEGTATAAQIEGYRVVGKTGTAEIASESGGYQDGVYNLSFVGYLPDTSTNLVCFVGAGEVPGERKTVASFKDIMTFAIDRYNITQD